MKYFLLSLYAILALSSGCSAQIDTDTKGQIDKIFTQWDNDHSPGVAIGIIQDGELVYENQYGISNLDYKIPLSPDSKFYIASIAKQFTAACIALLAIDGEIDLTDDIRKYFPEIPDYSNTITIQHLVNHTSGLRDYLNMKYLAGESFEDYFNNKEGVSLIARQQALNYQPNEEYLYSNSNYILLAELVKKVTGVSIREYADKKIFKPLGMNNTFFNDDHTQITKNRVISYQRNGKNGYRRFTQNFDGHGDGGMISTVRDLFLWDQNFYHTKVGGEAFIELMLSRKKLNNDYLSTYAFGLEHGQYKGLDIVVHGGNFLGFNHHFTRYPDQKFSVIVLANNKDIDPYFITDRISDIFLKEEFAAFTPPANTKSSKSLATIQLEPEQLQLFAGDYWNTNDNFSRKIYVKNDTLRFDRGMNNPSTLVPISKNEFKMLVNGNVMVKFETSTPGKRKMQVAINDERFFDFEEYQPASYDDAALANFAGSYYSPELDCTYELGLEKEELILYVNGKKRSPLKPVMNNLFSNNFAGMISFNERDSGEFEIKSNRVRGILFRKK